MTTKERYESAKARYAKVGVDTDKAIQILKNVPISLHCWQGDDVKGFDQDGPLTGGIQTTGNYPGKAMTPEELMADMEKVMSLLFQDNFLLSGYHLLIDVYKRQGKGNRFCIYTDTDHQLATVK